MQNMNDLPEYHDNILLSELTVESSKGAAGDVRVLARRLKENLSKQEILGLVEELKK